MAYKTAVLLLALVAPALLYGAGAALAAGANVAAWWALCHEAQTLPALALSVWTGTLSSALALAGALAVLSSGRAQDLTPRWVQRLGPMLATPHAAFAIGLAFLIAPSGWLLRALSPWATGLEWPPAWRTTQDPWGLGLTAVLVCKEMPFLLWAAATELRRPEVAQRWTQELALAQSLGYTPQRAWWRVLWPQLAPRLRWPLLAVLAYGLTVVDVALVIGPTSPPTLALLAWQWLLDGEAQVNAQGAAAAWLLALTLALLAGAWHGLSCWMRWRRRAPDGVRGGDTSAKAWQWLGRLSWVGLIAVYLMVMLALALGSVAGLWAFPALWPQAWTGAAWQAVAQSADSIQTTLTLGAASALAALLWSLAWLECAPPAWQAPLRRLLYLPLVLPSLLWVMGVHALVLRCGLDGRWLGLWLAHTLAALPYVLMALSPAYTRFDARYGQIAATLGHGRAVFLWRVKWPLLRAALASSLALGFAVSVAQYLPTLFIGAGRWSSVTTEALTLASGAQRSLASAYAWLQWLLPMLGFALAAWAGRPRRYE